MQPIKYKFGKMLFLFFWAFMSSSDFIAGLHFNSLCINQISQQSREKSQNALCHLSRLLTVFFCPLATKIMYIGYKALVLERQES